MLIISTAKKQDGHERKGTTTRTRPVRTITYNQMILIKLMTTIIIQITTTSAI